MRLQKELQGLREFIENSQDELYDREMVGGGPKVDGGGGDLAEDIVWIQVTMSG